MINPTPPAEFAGVIDRRAPENEERLGADNYAFDMAKQEDPNHMDWEDKQPDDEVCCSYWRCHITNLISTCRASFSTIQMMMTWILAAWLLSRLRRSRNCNPTPSTS